MIRRRLLPAEPIQGPKINRGKRAKLGCTNVNNQKTKIQSV
ncbi:MAG: hypothetical protein ACFFCE_19340 [Promethearchaeota archaeon]